MGMVARPVVLVVEDDEELRKLAKAVFEDTGHKIPVFYKGMDPVELLIYYVENFQVIRLVRQSSGDDLTGLYDFKTFKELARAQLKTARDRKRIHVFSLLLIDVDDFKHVNDDHGYLVGDELLRAIGAVLKKSVRPSDYICHKSGDEFLILLPDANENTAFVVGKKLQKKVSEIILIDSIGKEVSRTISFGVGQIQREEITEEDLDSSLGELLNRADVGPRGLKVHRQYERR